MWLPHFLDASQTKLEFFLTFGDSFSIGFGTTSFIQTLIEEIGFKAAVEEWSIEPCRAKYFSDYLDSDEWEDRWQLVWKVTAVSKQPINELPVFDTVLENMLFLSNEADDESYSLSHQPISSPARCLIISAFFNKETLEEAKSAINNHTELEKLQDIYSFDKPLFKVFQRVPGAYHLELDLGKFPDNFFREGAKYADVIERLCRTKKGLTHYQDLYVLDF
jgi:hypothetical protein